MTKTIEVSKLLDKIATKIDLLNESIKNPCIDIRVIQAKLDVLWELHHELEKEEPAPSDDTQWHPDNTL